MKKSLLSLVVILNFTTIFNTANAFQSIETSSASSILSSAASVDGPMYKKEIQKFAKNDLILIESGEDISISPIVQTQLERMDIDLKNEQEVIEALELLIEE